MKITISTPVSQPYQSILPRFDESLFQELSPPGTPVKIIRFDGSHLNDIVEVEIKLLGVIPQRWVSKITDEYEDDKQSYFVDTGTELPFFLSYWQHKHWVTKVSSSQSIITDAIEYKGKNKLLGYLLYPVLYLQFAWRKPIYRRIFGAS